MYIKAVENKSFKLTRLNIWNLALQIVGCFQKKASCWLRLLKDLLKGERQRNLSTVLKTPKPTSAARIRYLIQCTNKI